MDSLSSLKASLSLLNAHFRIAINVYLLNNPRHASLATENPLLTQSKSATMPVPFGFSVGDCISVCLLIKDTIKALDSVHGAKAEYEAVIRELWALDRALLEVLSLQETIGHGNSSTTELHALFVTVPRAVQLCEGSIKSFLCTIKGYEGSLDCGNGNGSLWRGVRGKISWALLRKDDLNKFRAEVNAHSSTINMLLITASL
jgi:hypothetical protein